MAATGKMAVTFQLAVCIISECREGNAFSYGGREHSAEVAQLSPAQSDAYEEGLGERLGLLCHVAHRHYRAACLCC
jgi:hypothetical protein